MKTADFDYYLPVERIAQHPIEPRDAEGVKTLEKLFQFDLELPSTVDDTYIGGRVFVRFDHGFEPLAFQWYRSLRLLFMRRFNV